jgi:soluble lytic murein transglycosylase-like protein
VWLSTVLLLILSVGLVDGRIRAPESPPLATPKQTVVATPQQPVVEPVAETPVSASVPDKAEIATDGQPAPVVHADARYMRQVRKTHHLYQPIIHRVAERYNVEPAMVKAIIMAESGYDPRAVSHRGARGLMQIMPRTARSLGVPSSFDPEHNITAGVHYFRQLLDTVAQDPALALAAYNAGPNKVRQYNGVPPYKATRRYIKKVMAYYLCYRAISRQGGSFTDQG